MPTLQVTPPRIRKRSCRLYPESGAETVEYIIVVLVAIVIGAGLLAFGNQVSGQVTKTGNSISSWFSKANGYGAPSDVEETTYAECVCPAWCF